VVGTRKNDGRVISSDEVGRAPRQRGPRRSEPLSNQLARDDRTVNRRSGRGTSPRAATSSATAAEIVKQAIDVPAGCSFPEAVEYLSGLAGLSPSRPSKRKIKTREGERRERAQYYHELLARHAELCAARRQARDQQRLVVQLLHRDPDGSDLGVRLALDKLGDPWLRELVLAQEVDALEAETAAGRRSSRSVR